MERETEEQYNQQRQIVKDAYNNLLDKLRGQVEDARDAALMCLEQRYKEQRPDEGWVDDVVDDAAPIVAPQAAAKPAVGVDPFGAFFESVNEKISETLRRENLRNWLADAERKTSI